MYELSITRGLINPFGHHKLILGYHVIPNLWLLQGGTVGGGGTIKWFKQELAGYEVEQKEKTGINVLKLMDDEAQRINPASDGVIFLPYMSGERSPIWDKNAKGVFFGLGFDKTRAHMIRSVLEGCAYALLHNLKTAEEAGVVVNELAAVGGTGLYKDFSEAVNRTIQTTKVYEPNMELHKKHLKYYEIYLKIYEKLKSTMEKVSKL